MIKITSGFLSVSVALLVLNAPQRLLAQPQKADICIYGGTSAGVIAAYTAGQLGKKVILVNPGKHIGGLSSGGLGQTDIGNKYAITGIAREFYRRVGQHYGKFEQWTFEPHVADEIFKDFLREENVKVITEYHLSDVAKSGTRITDVEFVADNNDNSIIKISASMFIDCSYEGDLMAASGVSYTVGRESNETYKETWNGVQLLDKHQFKDGVDPYKIPGDPNSGLLWGISSNKLAAIGSKDKLVQAYNFRLCLTSEPSNRIPITKPDGYDPSIFELLLRQLKSYTPDSLNWQLLHIAPMPNQKTDINNCGGFSSDMIGGNYDYVEASFNQRQEIVRSHELYTKSWLYFLGHDNRVPKHLRDEMLTWGYPKDEYVNFNNFTPQLYVREARRMIGSYVMTQHNCEGREIVKDGIGMAAYTMDSHNCQRIVVNGMVKNEGDVQIGGFGPYPISYRAIIPKKEECTNLLVPVCLSASHIAYGSIRMEPVFMVLGQSSAMATSMAIEKGLAIQDVNVEQLQNRLKKDPLADGSNPEILIDNENKEFIQKTGTWVKDEKLQHRYGQSLEFTNDHDATLTYTLPSNTKIGSYHVYIFCPPLSGISAKITARLKFKKTSDIEIEPLRWKDQWLSLGVVEGQKKKANSLTLRLPNAGKGYLFDDAILFVPVN